MKDGGPAFPVEVTVVDGEVRGAQTGPHNGMAPGISVLDYFAASVITGLIANPNVSKGVLVDGKTLNHADAAYVIAKGMLEARERARGACST